MSKRVLYYECFPQSKVPFDNFVSDAVLGAYAAGFELKPYPEMSIAPFSDDTMVVASVETTQAYFKEHLGKEIEPINYREVLGEFMGRYSEIVNIKDIRVPCFIKPNKIKAFTGFVVTGNPLLDVGFENMTYGYDGDVYMEEVLDIISEYRVYVRRGQIKAIKHYLGDSFLSLDRATVLSCVHKSRCFNQVAYTLDFGITKDGNTVLIEANDAWSIGNYGLIPDIYFNLIADRWFQILREKK